MRNFGVVWRFEMKQLVRKKSFLISTAVIAVLLVLVAVLPVWADTLFPAGDSQELEGGVYYQDQSLKGELPFAPEHVYDSQQALEDAVIAGDEPIGYVIVDPTHIKTVFDNYGINDTYKATGVISLLRERNTQQILQDYGVDAATYYQIRSITIENEEVVLGKNSAAQYFSEYLFVIAVYVVILVYGQTVATTVAREKDSRTMELLITTTSPDSLILGKVAAVITVVLGALLVYGVCLFVPYLLARGSYPESVRAVLANSFDLSLLWVYIMFFLLGLVMYMFLFAGLGSLVSKVEDVSSAFGSLTVLIVIAYALSFVQMMGYGGRLVQVCAWIPFFSILLMPLEYASAGVSAAGLWISVLVDLAFTAFLAYVSIRIYRFGSLNYGNRISLGKALKQVFGSKQN